MKKYKREIEPKEANFDFDQNDERDPLGRHLKVLGGRDYITRLDSTNIKLQYFSCLVVLFAWIEAPMGKARQGRIDR